MGEVINVDLNGARNILHIPESLGSVSWGQLTVRDGGNGLKTQPVVYRWTSRAEWVRTTPTSNEAMRMKTVNHKPINNPKTTPTLKDGEEVSLCRHQRRRIRWLRRWLKHWLRCMALRSIGGP